MATTNDGLYIASTGDNAVYRLTVRDGKLLSEDLIWRHPGTSDDRDDVHLNSLVVVKIFGDLVVFDKLKLVRDTARLCGTVSFLIGLPAH